MIRKLLLGGSAFAIAAMALLLTVGVGNTKSTEATVGSISATVQVVGVDTFAELHIVAEDDFWSFPTSTDDVFVTASAGDFVLDNPVIPGFDPFGCIDDFVVPCESEGVDTNGFADDGFDKAFDDSLDGPGDTQVDVCNDWGFCDLNVSEIEMWWQAPPGFAGGNVTFTAEQDGVTRTTTIVVVGSVATIELHALRDFSDETLECAGTPVYVIAAEEYDENNYAETFDNEEATLCAEARDSNGTLVFGAQIIWSTTDGCLDFGPVTTAEPLAHNQLESCVTGNSGDVATVRATNGSATDTVEVQFGGNPASCTVVVGTDPLDIGDTSEITATFLDSEGNWVPDGIVANFTEVDSGDGADNVEFVSTTEDTVKGEIGGNIIGAISGLVTVSAHIEGFAQPDVTCSEALEVSGDIHQHEFDCEDPDGILFGNAPPAGGGFGTFAFCGGTFEQLLAASGCPEATSAFFYNTPSGGWAVWIPGSDVAAVNAAIFAIFPQVHQPIPEGTIFTAKCV